MLAVGNRLSSRIDARSSSVCAYSANRGWSSTALAEAVERLVRAAGAGVRAGEVVVHAGVVGRLRELAPSTSIALSHSSVDQ